MALNSSGPISLAGTTAGQSIEIENGGNGTTQISLNDTAVRSLAGVTTPNSTIIMPTNFYGKSNRAAISYTFSANTANASLNVTSIGGYSAGKSDITITVNAGIYLYSTSTGTPGLTLSGGTTGDTVTLVNNGYIMGMGGAGAGGQVSTANFTAGSAGGTALSLGFNTTVNNTNASAYIGGGGGGGAQRGGGGGGGAGGGSANNVLYGATTITGGSGGSIGASGSNGGLYDSGCCSYYQAGAGGGRIFPGTGGAAGSGSTSAKGGGAGGGGGSSNGTSGAGGSGSSAGGNGPAASGGGGGGGGWGASGGSAGSGATAGGAGGKAVALNGNTVTWTSGNTTRVYGSVS